MASKQSRSAKSKSSPAASSPDTGLTSPATTMCASLPANDCALMASPMLMSLPEVSRAKTFRSLEKERDLRLNAADCGARLSDWLATFDQLTSAWRTSQICLVAPTTGRGLGLAEFSETWPRSGMTRNGTAFRLPTLVPGIAGTEFGFLPTPTKSADSKGSPKGRFFGSGTCFSNLREVLRDGPDDPVFPNPEFVEGMMGFPPLWTDCAASETP